MVYFLGVFQFILLGIICIYEFRQKSSVVFMWATLLIMFGIMHLLASFMGDITYADYVLVEASFFVILFCIIYLITRVTLATNILKKHRVKLSYENIKKTYGSRNVGKGLLIVLITVGIIKIYPYLRSVSSILLTSWGNKYAYDTSLSYVNSNSVLMILFFSLSGVVLIYLIERQYFLCIIAGIMLLLNVTLTRNRIEVLPLLCSVVTFFIVKNKRVKLKTVLLAALGGIAVIYFVYALRVFRHYGTIQTFMDQFELMDFIERINLYITTDNGELGLRRYFYEFIASDNDFADFGKGYSYIRMLLVYVPTRWSLGLKPADFAITMGSALGMRTGVSIHPTLFGDCYANLGFLGIILGAFWATYATIIDKITIQQKSITTMFLIYVLSAVSYVIIGRGSVYNGFWYVAFGVLLIIICSIVFEKCAKKKIRIKL